MKRKRKTAGQRLFEQLNEKFQHIGGFDITDDQVRTRKDAIEKARAHINWFLDWAQEAADSMEDELRERMTERERWRR